MHAFNILLVILVTFQTDLITGQEFETTNGMVRGMRTTVMGKSLDVFHGIPFAKPPVGDLRFKHTQPADSWRPAVKNTTMETPACMQSTTQNDQFPDGDPRKLPGALSDDCLYLSIWKPASASLGSNEAVMVWIYGGSFQYGSTSIPAYTGKYLVAENDVIMVSINYRLGPLGFSYLDTDTIPGNMGLMDQLQGLKWVKNNIAKFGGDINRITIFGESAGSFSIAFHLMSPLSRGLFNNAILQSGVPMNSIWRGLLLPKADVRKLFDLVMCPGIAHSGADILQCMNNADAQAIVAASEQLSLAGISFLPVVDGHFFEFDPLEVVKRDEHQKVNILTGLTKDEMTMFFSSYFNATNMVVYTTGQKFSEDDFEPAVRLLTEIKDSDRRIKAIKRFYESELSPPEDYVTVLNHASTDTMVKCPTLQFSHIYTKSSDVYLYQLNIGLSFPPVSDWMGVQHTTDIPIVFGLPFVTTQPFSDRDRELSRNVMKYWANFAKSAVTYPPDVTWPSGSGTCTGSVYVILNLLTVSVWMLL